MLNDREKQKVLSKWVPMPRYLLRCWVVKRLIRSLRPRDFIEIGSASGDMANWLSEEDIPGVAVEISPQALEMIHARLDGNEAIEIFDRDARELDRSTDLLLSMEVLEHLEHDEQALADWFRLVRPGGHLLLSVPAGKKLFSEEDVMVGHFRRYEKDELHSKIVAAGFEKPRILAYGFPLGLILKKMRNIVARRKLKSDRRSKQERTEASGVERDFSWLRFILNDFFFFPFHVLQSLFFKFDCTDGYIAVARKPRAA